MAVNLNPFKGIQTAQQTVSALSSFARDPQKLLALTPLSWGSGTTLSRMEARGDPIFTCYWTIAMPNLPFAQQVNQNLLSQVSKLDSKGLIGGTINKWAGSSALDFVNKGVEKYNQAADFVNSNSMVTQIGLDPEYVESVTQPEISFSQREVFRAGAYWKYAEQSVQIDSVTLTFFGDRELKAFRYLENWRQLIQSNSGPNVLTGGWNLPNDPVNGYKKTITVGIADENNTEFYLVDYLGCWPTNISAEELESDGGNRLIYTATFSLDQVRTYGYDMITAKEKLMAFGGNMAEMAKGAVADAVMPAVSGIANTVTDFLTKE